MYLILIKIFFLKNFAYSKNFHLLEISSNFSKNFFSFALRKFHFCIIISFIFKLYFAYLNTIFLPSEIFDIFLKFFFNFIKFFSNLKIAFMYHTRAKEEKNLRKFSSKFTFYCCERFKCSFATEFK